ncbi:MAG: hypothetical protein ACI4L9_02490 [Candidatus Coproplasma sp.]
MADDRRFKYTYRAPTEEERREIEAIRREYYSDGGQADKFEELKKLDRQVKVPPRVAGITTGVAGTLAFGGGMALVTSYGQTVWGIVLSVAGIAIAAAAYFIYGALLKRNRKKYSKKILELSDELLNNERKN